MKIAKTNLVPITTFRVSWLAKALKNWPPSGIKYGGQGDLAYIIIDPKESITTKMIVDVIAKVKRKRFPRMIYISYLPVTLSPPCAMS